MLPVVSLWSLTRHLRMLVLALATAGSAMPARAVEEADLKAAIIFNLLAFVEWPAKAAPAPQRQITVCVAPRNAMRNPLQALAGLAVQVWRLEVRDIVVGEDLARCHAVVVASPAQELALAQLRALRTEPVVVFSEAPHEPEDGTSIHLAVLEGKVRFDVDIGNTRRAGLQISSKLMRLARAVNE